MKRPVMDPVEFERCAACCRWPPHQLRVAHLVWVESYTVAEAAAELHVSEARAGEYLARCRPGRRAYEEARARHGEVALPADLRDTADAVYDGLRGHSNKTEADDAWSSEDWFSLQFRSPLVSREVVRDVCEDAAFARERAKS